MGVERFDHLKKVRRHLGNRKAKEVFDLLQTIMTAMPFVKPITIEIGMNLIKPPSLKSPMKNSMMPDPDCRKHQIGDPVLSNDAVDDDDESACGPPICTRQPPKSEIRKPAMMAV